jgi:hypothetical protein
MMNSSQCAGAQVLWQDNARGKRLSDAILEEREIGKARVAWT